jgi:hypothetical protein
MTRKYTNALLVEPILIADQHWDAEVVPLVSISCITYNHEKFIREAIEGFLIQKTNFPVEILIHDDASTDGLQTYYQRIRKKIP